jgi:hypothetical protein
MLAPIGVGHESNPHFTIPILDGLVGAIELGEKAHAGAKLVQWDWKKLPQGFETTGELLTNDGRLKQRIKVTSLGEKTVVYQDQAKAQADISLKRELGAPIGIENDELSGGQRVIYHKDGKTILNWRDAKGSFTIPGKWVNVDGRLGVMAVKGSGMTYSHDDRYNNQGVCTDILYGSFSDQPKDLNAQEDVARRVVILFVEVTPEETATLMESIKLESRSEGDVLRIILPEGGAVDVPLL